MPAEHLPEYVAGFQDVLDEQGTFASFYAHAGPGVLHIRPLVSTKTVEGLEQMENIAEGATDLVVEYGGSVSGEHGDGRARTQWNKKLYGEHLWNVFRDLKTAFDPDWLLNPGQVCGLRLRTNRGARTRNSRTSPRTSGSTPTTSSRRGSTPNSAGRTRTGSREWPNSAMGVAAVGVTSPRLAV